MQLIGCNNLFYKRVIKMKKLVVYYSHSGVTRNLARKIQTIVDADIYEIEPIEPYPADVYETIEIFRDEKKNKLRRPIQEPDVNVEDYDILIIGTPNWGNSVATPLLDFFEKVDMHEKLIIPFITHGGGGVGNCASDIIELTNAKQNFEPLVVGSRGVSEDDIKKWLENIEKC